jgi:hypothetical protein
MLTERRAYLTTILQCDRSPVCVRLVAVNQTMLT